MFITFEGIDFSGKTTQIRLLEEYLKSAGEKVHIVREPGGTAISEKIRELLLDKNYYEMCSEAEIFLFSASRAQLVRELIKPMLEEGYFVISDRFHDSTTAYQGYGRGVDLDTVCKINELAIGDVIPDLTFFLDLDEVEAQKRKDLLPVSKLDRIESANLEFFRKVREGYLYLSKSEKRFRLINGSLSVEEIHKRIVKEMNFLSRVKN